MEDEQGNVHVSEKKNKIGGPMVTCRWLAEQSDVDPVELGRAAAALFEVRSSKHAVPVLLRLLKHAAAAVRVGACHGLAAHAVPAAIAALGEASEKDPDPAVREEAARASDLLWNSPIDCANGCGAPATLKSDDERGGADHHAAFCGETCAAEWALARVRDEMHVCRSEGHWEYGTEEECEDCQAAEAIGEDEPDE